MRNSNGRNSPGTTRAAAFAPVAGNRTLQIARSRGSVAENRRANVAPAIALAGCGCVGGALLERIAHRNAREPEAGRLEIDRVLVRRRTGRRRLIPDDLVVTTDVDAFLDTEAPIVVEAIGGLEPAVRIARETLARGACFVTANKAVIAEEGQTLRRIAERNGGQLLFEGAVGGGIPIVRTLRHGFAGASISRITGILNGTCNFILSEMESGRTFTAALDRARRLGYAEADPSRDLDGRDAADKIRILAWLAWDVDPREVHVETTGLGDDPDALVGRAKAEGKTARLIAECRLDNDDTVRASVKPASLPTGSAFAGTIGTDNRIHIETVRSGVYVLAGPGAGGPETASAVLADIIVADTVVRSARLAWAE